MCTLFGSWYVGWDENRGEDPLGLFEEDVSGRIQENTVTTNRIVTHCALRLGDNLAALQFLRGVAKQNPETQFVHYAHEIYIPELIDVVSDLPNIALNTLDFSQCGGAFWHAKPLEKSIDLWKNRRGFWENHPSKLIYPEVMVAFFNEVAKEMEVENPIKEAKDFLFDYSALKSTGGNDFDFLVINSQPMSNQACNFDPHEMERLICELSFDYRVITTKKTRVAGVECTQDLGLSITDIGRLSQRVDYIIMVSTGPSWPTFNIWNVDSVKLRLIIIDHEFIGLSKNTEQKLTAGGARQSLQWKGIL